ncbi:hypothetical protein BDR26DRAFT_849995 [Obelidium mucronatum]|nr:hypothetical protein BDR26DRAFT_849995 [Obelidium mucronatum]
MEDNSVICIKSLGVTLAVNCSVQLVFYAASVLRRLETLFNLSAILTTCACVLAAILVRFNTDSTGEANEAASLSQRQLIASVLLVLASLLQHKKQQEQLKGMKDTLILFTIPWLVQCVWLFTSGFPVYLLLGNITVLQPDLGASDFAGVFVWGIGFILAAVARTQAAAISSDTFVQTGLFRYSRYPQIFGEVVLWTGLFILCSGGIVDSWQWVSVASPVVVLGTLVFITGAESEADAEEQFGYSIDYMAYKESTNAIIPWLPSTKPVFHLLTSKV